jgi:hypothetical protein
MMRLMLHQTNMLDADRDEHVGVLVCGGNTAAS